MEELKMILEAVDKLGTTGAWLFAAYLIHKTLHVIVVLGGVVLIVRVIAAMVTKLVAMNSFAYEVGSALGYSYSELWSDYYSDPVKKRKLIEELHELKRKRSDNGIL